MRGKILVGTASWADPSFVEKWYPKSLAASDRLKYYSERFSIVELNSSFYGIPKRANVERWCSQTPSGFLFDVKLHKYFSRHATKPELFPRELRPLAEIRRGKAAFTPKLERALAQWFLREIEPFEEAGKLGAFLLQLSPGFRPKTNQLEELDSLIECFGGYRIAIEFRNRSWIESDQLGVTAAFCKKRRVAFVDVDAPEDNHFTVMPRLDLVTKRDLGYLRCHGRNARGYVSGRTVAERFDYDYPANELHEIAGRALHLAESAKEVHLIYNNNAADYAPKAAARTQEILTDMSQGISARSEKSLAGAL